jgi:hypothetical protein
MVGRRPRMRRSHWNATILIFTCLIRRSDGSHMSSLISVVGYLGFSYKQSPWPTLSRFFLSPVRRLPFRCFSFFLSFSTPRRTGRRSGSQLGTGTNWFVLLPLRFAWWLGLISFGEVAVLFWFSQDASRSIAFWWFCVQNLARPLTQKL